MRSERDAEQLELEAMQRIAQGPPSAESWAEIIATILRLLTRTQRAKATGSGSVDLIGATMSALEELEEFEPGEARVERTRELLERIEHTAVSEYERVDRMSAQADCLTEVWEGAFDALDASLAHWPDTLRVLPYAQAGTLRADPGHRCWTILRRVELRAPSYLRSLRTSHPHLMVTLQIKVLSDFDDRAIPMIDALELNWGARETLSRLAEYDGWSGLRALRLYNAELSVGQIREMGDAGMFSGVEELSLRHCELGPEVVAELVEHLDPSRLTHLDLTHSLPGAAGLRHLLSLTAARPTYLDLTGCGLDASSMARLSRSRFAQDTLHLGLSMNPIEDAGAFALANSSTFVGLRHLELRGTRINDDAASALADSVHLLDLRELDVRDNRLTQTGLVALATSEYLDRLERLDVTGNHVDQRTWLRLISDEVAHAPLRAHLRSQLER